MHPIAQMILSAGIASIVVALVVIGEELTKIRKLLEKKTK